MLTSKVSVRRLEVSLPPLPREGGIITSEAGDLFQIVNGPNIQFLAYIEFLPQGEGGRPRGNHYHEKKIETLVVLRGRLLAQFLDLDTMEFGELEIVRGDVVTIQPRCAHAYWAQEYSQALEIAPDQVAIADTFPIDLTLPR